ncbi:IS110 family transposase [Pedobacter sp. HMF7647]|uniref:IS110 family transposase n=1 Tax=Hufsiella arboris TaxID=2695275 RepID=A0A7K1YFH0_9SPHI|nr:IS110 family transposase [Hufsiella arboris]MXV53357.1 IS110 family transposase [Hufsiella arboris]
MNYTAFIGIDVSKLTFDAFICGKHVKQQFDNNDKGFSDFMHWLKKHLSAIELKSALICFEHTGIYSLSLSLFFQQQSVLFTIVPALDIKHSIGTTRGKSDQLDAQRIAAYAYAKREKLIPTKLAPKVILRLQPLLSLRDQLVTDRARYKSTCKEREAVYKQDGYFELFTTYQDLIQVLNEKIKAIDQTIEYLLIHDPETKTIYSLITSVKGIGPLTAAYLIVYTHNFTRFDCWRKFACYAGIAPFPHTSGTSIKSKTRVSHLANKHIKSLLFLCANNAVKTDPELKAYYQKRVNEGKSKMSTLNVIKNKLVARVFAVAKRQTPFIIKAA